MPQEPLPSREIVLECIAGKDNHRKISIAPQQTVTIGHFSLQPDLASAEFTTSQGYLIFHNENGALGLDGTNTNAPLFLNNTPVNYGLLRLHDTLRIGDSMWRMRYAGDKEDGASIKFSPGGLKERFDHLIGLEALQDFKLGSIFSEVFKKHSVEEMEDQLITGTRRNTPALTDIETGWARPWLFARLLLVSVLLAFVLKVGFDMFENSKLVPGLIFVGSFAVPVSTLIFFLEMNAPRNVSIFMITQLLFGGGVASIIVALIFFSRFDFFSTYLGASAAGIIEEWAKLLIVILFVGKTTRYKWILNGLLFGAAIGTGFAAFESAGYAFNDIWDSGGLAKGVTSIVHRGILSPFGHIVWTANSAAALWMVKKDKPFAWEMLGQPAFLRVMIASMLLHMLWNAPFSLMPLPLIFDLKYLIIGILGWTICFRLVQAGLTQLNKARQEEMLRIKG